MLGGFRVGAGQFLLSWQRHEFHLVPIVLLLLQLVQRILNGVEKLVLPDLSKSIGNTTIISKLVWNFNWRWRCSFLVGGWLMVCLYAARFFQKSKHLNMPARWILSECYVFHKTRSANITGEIPNVFSIRKCSSKALMAVENTLKPSFWSWVFCSRFGTTPTTFGSRIHFGLGSYNVNINT